MKETKFINKEMALMAATTAFMAAVKMGKYCNLSGAENCLRYHLDVYLEPDELFTLPSGYVYSGVKEHTYNAPGQECPPFKTKKYYFEF